ncbi:MAG: efflux RND transporter permease subunit, partial [Proteobacteria bacterium]|nr:efflux RND transporter permease subunit [Pseudomonadota bacterium]
METSENKNQKMPDNQAPGQEPEEKKKEPIVVEKSLFHGPLAWMAQNSVAANLLFFMFLVAGLVMLPSLRKELMPNTETERIMVSASYPGSTPDEVEEGIVMAIEESVRGINGVKQITSTASEGSGSVMVELRDGVNVMKARNEIERAVDQITTFPKDMDKPSVKEMARKSSVLSVIVYGDTNKAALREIAEEVRDSLISQDGISMVELQNVESPEISVEISQEAVQAYGLKISDVASAISSSSVDLTAGNLKAESGAVTLRTTLRKRYASEFENVVLKSGTDGRVIKLSDVATVTDGYEESDYSAQYNGKPAVQMTVYCLGDETPVGVSDAVHKYIDAHAGTYPNGIEVGIRNDRADSYRVRIDLLMRNAYSGLILVLLFLGLLLDVRIAFWAAMGMLTAFVGSIAVMVLFDVSFNMISLFGFILALGIVVDDSIVIGEEFYVNHRKGVKGIIASLMTLKSVSVPVIFSVLTSIIAFIPLMFLPGMLGKTYRDLPIIVIIILCISIAESMLILPAHLSHMKRKTEGFLKLFEIMQRKIANGFEWFINKFVRKFIVFCVRYRYAVVALSIALLIGTIGYVASGRLRYTMMPEVEGDQVTASIRMAEGSPVSRIREVEKYVLQKTQETMADFGEEHFKGYYSQISGGTSAMIQVYQTPANEREGLFASSDFSRAWRTKVGEIPGVEALSFRFNQGPGGGGGGG